MFGVGWWVVGTYMCIYMRVARVSRHRASHLVFSPVLGMLLRSTLPMEDSLDAVGADSIETEANQGVVAQLILPLVVEGGVDVADACHHPLHRVLVRLELLKRGGGEGQTRTSQY